MNEAQKIDSDGELEGKYLSFILGGEHYLSPLSEISQAIEVKPTKTLPNTEGYFEGVFSHKGEIYGVIDLSVKFQLKPAEQAIYIFILFDYEDNRFAIKAEHARGVVKIDSEAIHKKPKIVSKIPLPFIKGMVEYDDDIYTILDLKSLLNEEAIHCFNSQKVNYK